MYLALAGETYACIEEFRLLTWRMIVKTAIYQHASLPPRNAPAGEWGLAADLAERAGNRTMGLLARLAELLMRIAHGEKAPDRDPALEAAIRDGDCAKAFERLDTLLPSGKMRAPIVALDVVERGFSLAGRKSAMALAARMARELSGPGSTQEAEWETAQRLGYTENVVRQARRILQDFGVLRCRQGRKGAEFAPPTAPTGIIRLLAPSLVASASLAVDIREAIFFLVGSATIVAADRVGAEDRPSVRTMASSSSLDPLEALTLENRLMELSGNPLLAIVVRSLGLANTFIAKDALIPPHLGEIMALNRRILRAIEQGDAAGARSLAQAKFDLMQQPADYYQDVA
jgi:DNA-binding FadR family transcriptional regulator